MIHHEITRATDIRDKLKTIAAVEGNEGSHLIKKFIEKPNSLESCYEVARAKGEVNALFNVLKTFHTKISSFSTRLVVKNIPLDRKKEFNWEFEKIKENIEKLMKLNSN